MVPFTNFKRVLESLSSSEFTAFVIELWKARGQKVLIEENVFIAKSNVRKTN